MKKRMCSSNAINRILKYHNKTIKLSTIDAAYYPQYNNINIHNLYFWKYNNINNLLLYHQIKAFIFCCSSKIDPQK